MRFVVMDVGHGLCAYAVAQNDSLFVFDCGHDEQRGIRPSAALPRPADGTQPTITRLMITNYDEDHISDIENLRRDFNIQILHRNKSVSGEQLKALKREGGPISNAMSACIEMIENYTGGVPSPPPPMPGLSWRVFCNTYGSEFTDTNNISTVTFLTIGSRKVVIPGDVEEAGWLRLLEDPDFRSELNDVEIFVASHHGRKSGYCAEVFRYCAPKVVVISDGPITQPSQDYSSVYGQHASGLPFQTGTDVVQRKVVSTRQDGELTFSAQ